MSKIFKTVSHLTDPCSITSWPFFFFFLKWHEAEICSCVRHKTSCRPAISHGCCNTAWWVEDSCSSAAHPSPGGGENSFPISRLMASLSWCGGDSELSYWCIHTSSVQSRLGDRVREIMHSPLPSIPSRMFPPVCLLLHVIAIDYLNDRSFPTAWQVFDSKMTDAIETGSLTWVCLIVTGQSSGVGPQGAPSAWA